MIEHQQRNMGCIPYCCITNNQINQTAIIPWSGGGCVVCIVYHRWRRDGKSLSMCLENECEGKGRVSEC